MRGQPPDAPSGDLPLSGQLEGIALNSSPTPIFYRQFGDLWRHRCWGAGRRRLDRLPNG